MGDTNRGDLPTNTSQRDEGTVYQSKEQVLYQPPINSYDYMGASNINMAEMSAVTNSGQYTYIQQKVVPQNFNMNSNRTSETTQSLYKKRDKRQVSNRD